MKFFITIFVTCFLAACAPVQEKTSISQPLNAQLTAGVGDIVLSISKEKNLPNAFGKSDVFGRMTPTGLTTVQYLGVKNGKAIFRRRSITIETGATTMNSTPLVIPNSHTTNHSGMVGGVAYSGTSTSSLPPTVIPANTPDTQVLDHGAVEISLDLKKAEKTIVVDGKTIAIGSADSSMVVYSILE